MIKKIFLALGILLLIILASAMILPIVYKDKIVAMVKDETNKKVNAKVDFGDFDLSLLRHFPSLTVSISNLSVIGINEFANDTLTYVKDFSISVDLMSVIKGDQIAINSIRLQQPLINLIVLKNGKSNWDISKPDSSAKTESSPSKFKIALRKYEITNGNISYDDASMGFKMDMQNLNHSGNGDFTQDLFILNTLTSIDQTNMWYGGVKYLHQVKTNLKADLEMDMAHKKYTFKDNELSLNELVLGMDGWVAMPTADITMDLKFEAKKNEFRNFLSLVPGVYRDGFKDLKSAGTLALKAFVKGTYNTKQMPGFGANVKIQNGMFQYPSLPVAVNNVQVDLNINNADGVPDHTEIDLVKLHTELGTEPFDAKLRVRTPVSDADMDGAIVGHVNFANIAKIIPLEAGTSLRGIMQTNITFKGRMSAIQQKRYQDFKAAGSLMLADFNYSSKDYQQGFDLKTCNLTFNPQNVTLNSFIARMGSSDFNATGTLDNLLAYVFKKETLKGTLTLNSKQINLKDFESSAAPATAVKDTTPLTLVQVPANFDFVMATQIGHLIMDNLQLDNLLGKIIIRDQAVTMDNLSFNTMKGSMKMSGVYATRERKKADMQFNMHISNFDIQETVKTFNTVKTLAPIAQNASGSFGTDMTLAGKLDEHMKPILPTLTGGGKLTTSSVVITNFAPLAKVADLLKMDQFKKLPVSNVNISYKFANGRVNVDPFNVDLAGIPTTISGSTGFDQTIDYKLGMNIPTSKIPSQATNVVSGLMSQANAKGAKLSVGQNVKVTLGMGGTVSKPTLKTDMKDAVGSATDMVKEKVNAEIDAKKKEVEDKAKAEAKTQADKLKKEAADKAKGALKNLFGK